MIKAITTIKIPKFTKKEKLDTLDPFFPVSEQKLIREDGEPTNLRALVNTVTNKTMGSISKSYKVITHSEVSSIVKDFLDTIGLKATSLGAKTSNGGARFFETLTFPSLAFNPASAEHPSTAVDQGTNLQVDDFIPTITLLNSYDKTTPSSWAYGMYRLRCSNGMAILVDGSNSRVSFRHNQIVNEALVRESIVGRLEESSIFMGQMYQKLNGNDGSSLLIDLLQSNIPDKFKALLLSKVTPFANIISKETLNEDGQRYNSIESVVSKVSAYAIYNIATEIATHEVHNRSDSEKVSNTIARLIA